MNSIINRNSELEIVNGNVIRVYKDDGDWIVEVEDGDTGEYCEEVFGRRKEAYYRFDELCVFSEL